MIVVPAGYRKLDRKIQVKVGFYVTGAALALLFALFWLLVGGIGFFIPENPNDRIIGFAVILVGGLSPAALAGLLGVKAAMLYRKGARLERLVVLLRRDPQAAIEALARNLGIDSETCERLVFEATAHGALRDDPAPDSRGSTPVEPQQSAPVVGERAVTFESAPSRQPSELRGEGLSSAPLGASREPSRGIAWVEERGSNRGEEEWGTATNRSGWGGGAGARTLAGQVLNGTYQIEELLGEGGMGAVYVARHLRTGRRYAVKALHRDARFSEDAIRRFKREAAAASALGHRGIVAIHDFDVTADGVHFMVSELLLGETLEARLDRLKSFPWSAAANIVCEVGEALQVAHDAGILHRDLKPGNIFIDRGSGADERIVLLDFGLAKSLESAGATKITTTGTVVGTPLYMSPEQACSDNVDARSDIYALGVVFYELLTGAPPFMADTIAGVYSRLLNESPPPPRQRAPHPLPADTDELFAHVLCKDPSERFQTARAFVGAIREIRRRCPELEQV
jgi:tRNA A-37 threonylcarbamoyl transferase component Bud32